MVKTRVKKTFDSTVSKGASPSTDGRLKVLTRVPCEIDALAWSYPVKLVTKRGVDVKDVVSTERVTLTQELKSRTRLEGKVSAVVNWVLEVVLVGIESIPDVSAT